MTKEELAAALNGREYREEISAAEEQAAKKAGLVVVFGASDDLMEFRGAIYDEIGAYEGGVAHLTSKGLLANKCDDDGCPYFRESKRGASTITATWGGGGFSWTYKTKIPHATFEVMEGGEKYCRGIVFSLADVTP